MNANILNVKVKNEGVALHTIIHFDFGYRRSAHHGDRQHSGSHRSVEFGREATAESDPAGAPQRRHRHDLPAL